MSREACLHQKDRLPQFTSPDTSLLYFSNGLWAWSERDVGSVSALEPGWGWGITGLREPWAAGDDTGQPRPGPHTYLPPPCPSLCAFVHSSFFVFPCFFFLFVWFLEVSRYHTKLPCKVNYSVALDHLCLIPEHFYHLQRKPFGHEQSLPIPPHPTPGNHQRAVSLDGPAGTFPIRGIMQPVAFWVCCFGEETAACF